LTDDGTMKSVDLSFYVVAFESEAFQQGIELSKLLPRIASLFYSISATIAERWCHALVTKGAIRMWLLADTQVVSVDYELRGCSAAREISDSQNNMFVSDVFAVAVPSDFQILIRRFVVFVRCR
jgi:hypothetical protein